jgi:hypothetical protein
LPAAGATFKVAWGTEITGIGVVVVGVAEVEAEVRDVPEEVLLPVDPWVVLTWGDVDVDSGIEPLIDVAGWLTEQSMTSSHPTCSSLGSVNALPSAWRTPRLALKIAAAARSSLHCERAMPSRVSPAFTRYPPVGAVVVEGADPLDVVVVRLLAPVVPVEPPDDSTPQPATSTPPTTKARPARADRARR